MNRAKLHTESWAAQIAILGVALGVTASALAATATTTTNMSPGGTISFRGMLIAPPFTVATYSSGESNAFSTGVGAASENGATVSFIPSGGDAPNATVSVKTASASAQAGRIDTRFVDGCGQRVVPSANGAFHIGATGGLLTMRGKDGGLATVVTSYN